jgi:hypothetical protein
VLINDNLDGGLSAFLLPPLAQNEQRVGMERQMEARWYGCLGLLLSSLSFHGCYMDVPNKLAISGFPAG